MKSLFLIMFTFVLIGCNSNKRNKAITVETLPQHKIKISSLGHVIYRVENEEVICYYEYDGGMDCKFKENK